MKVSNEEFLRRAIQLSKEKMIENNGGPFGAVIVMDNRIIAEGYNQVTSKNDPTAHAEIIAIRNACEAMGDFHLEGAEIYCSCEPCPMCLAAIYWSRIARIYYANTREDAKKIGFDDNDFYIELTKQDDQRKIPSIQLLAEEGKGAFAAWTNKDDKVPY